MSNLVLLKSFKDFFEKNVFETPSTWNQPCLVILWTFIYFFIETHLFFQKKREIDRFDNSWAILRFETHCGKKITKLSDFPNFQGFFWGKIIGFFQENPFFQFFEVSQPKILFGKLFKKTRPCVEAFSKKTQISSQEHLNSERFVLITFK